MRFLSVKVSASERSEPPPENTSQSDDKGLGGEGDAVVVLVVA